MAPVDKFLALEDAVAREVAAILEPYLDPLAELAASLVAERDFAGARAVVDSVYVDQDGRDALAAAFRPRVYDAAVLGASRLVPASATFVARGFMDPTLVDAAVAQHVELAASVMIDRLKSDMHRLVTRAEQLAAEERDEGVLRSDGAVVTKALGVGDIAARLNRAAFTGRPALASVSANLATSRLSGYGFLDQASRNNVRRFQITEQLDNLTCPVCWRTHGQVYEVEQALSQTNSVLRTTDPEQLKQIAPWPSQSKAGLAAYDAMTPEQRAEAGYNRPPFHPYCRGQLVPVGTAAPVPPDEYPDDIPRPAETAPEPQVVEPPELSAVERMRLAPEGVLDEAGFEREFGVPAGRMLDAEAGYFVRGLPGAVVEEAALSEVRPGRWRAVVSAVDEAGARATVSRDFYRDAQDRLRVVHRVTRLPATAGADGSLRASLRDAATVYRDIGPDPVVELSANVDTGSYAWARYGALPTSSSWRGLRSRLRRRLDDMDVPADIREDLGDLLASDDPAALWDVVDARYPVAGQPVGRALLRGETWAGEIDLGDPRARARFEAYMGRT